MKLRLAKKLGKSRDDTTIPFEGNKFRRERAVTRMVQYYSRYYRKQFKTKPRTKAQDYYDRHFISYQHPNVVLCCVS